MGTVTFGEVLPGKVEKCSLISFCVPFFFPSSAFKKSFHSRNACDAVIDRIKVENLILWDSSGPLSLNRHDTRS